MYWPYLYIHKYNRVHLAMLLESTSCIKKTFLKKNKVFGKI